MSSIKCPDGVCLSLPGQTTQDMKHNSTRECSVFFVYSIDTDIGPYCIKALESHCLSKCSNCSYCLTKPPLFPSIQFLVRGTIQMSLTCLLAFYFSGRFSALFSHGLTRTFPKPYAWCLADKVLENVLSN